MKTKVFLRTFASLCFCLQLIGAGEAQNCFSGTVATTEGATTVYTCPGDGNADVINFSSTTDETSALAFAITNSDNIILAINEAGSQDFEGAGQGTCRVWGFNYTGQIMAQAGESVFSTSFSTGCWAISSNAIAVIRAEADGGTVALNTGETSTSICSQDGYPDPVIFTHQTNSNAAYRYIITDEQNTILGLPPGDNNDFEGVPGGVCRVWGLSYTGNLTATMGQNAAEVALSDACFELSENFIEINRTRVDGGTIATTEGQTEVNTIPGDGIDDLIGFSHTTGSDAQYGYIITNEQNQVLGLPGNSQNFEGAGEGVCLVWGISYTGDLTIYPGDDILDKALSSDCFDLSSNIIRVVRTATSSVSGGTVAMPSGNTKRYTCTQDGNADVVNFVSTDASGDNFIYVITSPSLEILGIESNDFHDFDGAPPGTCWVWGLAYSGTLTAQVGQNAGTTALADGDFDLSDNFIEVIRDNVNGGTVAMPSGNTKTYTCTQDGQADAIDFVPSGASNSKYAYIITAPSLEILGIEMNDFHDFDGAPPGTCWVWGLAYTGNLTASVGDNAGMISLSDDCYDLSDNYIEVVRDQVDGGSVYTDSGESKAYTCPQDGIPDVISFSNMGVSNSRYQYVITDNNNMILALPEGSMADFDGAAPGTCRVWGFSYTGALIAEPGVSVFEVQFSTDCWAISENAIEIIRDQPDGGTVSTFSGETQVNLVAGDGLDDVLSFVSEGASNSKYTYVITDENNNILGLPPSNSQNFEGAGAGICRVWGLSYTGNIIASPGNNAASVALSDDCFELSDNFIEVIRTSPDANLNVQFNQSLWPQAQIKLFPNPVVSTLTLDFGQSFSEENNQKFIRIIDIAGQLLLEKQVDASSQQQIDLSGLNDGVYLLQFYNGKEVQHHKIIKQ